eukprot:6817884-Prymnesium_polylepis.1
MLRCPICSVGDASRPQPSTTSSHNISQHGMTRHMARCRYGHCADTLSGLSKIRIADATHTYDRDERGATRTRGASHTRCRLTLPSLEMAVIQPCSICARLLPSA